MGTITQRKNKKGDTKYSAQIRLRRNGAIVYQEAQTFDRKQMAQAWLKRRETELAEPGAIERANRKGVTIKEMIDRYLEEYEALRPLGKTKRATLKAIGETWLGPTLDELDNLMGHYVEMQTRRKAQIDMPKIIAFAIFSTCRQEEITRIRWDDLDELRQAVLVRDMKNPGQKIGNDVWCHLPDEAWAIMKTDRCCAMSGFSIVTLSVGTGPDTPS